MWSSPEAAAQWWLHDMARRQRPHDWEREPDPPRSHSCQPCRAGPPMTGATNAVASPCRGLLGPPRRGPLTPRPLRRRAETLARTTEREGRSSGGGMREERWLIRHACRRRRVRVRVQAWAGRVEVQAWAGYRYRRGAGLAGILMCFSVFHTMGCFSMLRFCYNVTIIASFETT